MTQERNKSSVRRLYEECINPGKLELLDELISIGYAGVHCETGPRGFDSKTAKSSKLGPRPTVSGFCNRSAWFHLTRSCLEASRASEVAAEDLL